MLTHNHDWTTNNWVKIDYNDLENKPTIYEPKYFQSYDTRLAWTFSSWTFTVTCWFRPKKIEIKANRVWDREWASIWTCIVDESWDIQNWCIFLDWDYSNIWRTSETTTILIKQTAYSSYWVITSITDTWFTISVSNTWTFYAIITVTW